MPGNVHYQFLSYSRRGMAAAVAVQDTLGKPGATPIPGLASFDVTVPVVSSPGATDPAPVTRTVAVNGPGDVTGLTPRAVVRTWPANGQTNAETTFFPLVEFDHPDLPWLFTPAAPGPPGPAGSGESLRPWLVLVVVEQHGAPDDAALQRGDPLSRLVVPQAAAWQLPDLAESWLWAHAQVTPLDGETVEAALAGDPRRNLSRLLCPRRLRPQTHYLACVVPAFDVGCKAGLGDPVLSADEQALTPAFQPGAATTLPVYYQWTFATGGAGDFETLARKLTGHVLPNGVGRRALDVSHPGPGLPVVEGVTGIGDTRAVLALEGALRRPKAAPGQWAEPQRSAFVGRLTEILDTPARLVAAGSGASAGPHTVAPPIYGQFHAACVTLGSGNPPPWLRELNTDPGRRVTAARGTEVIQDHQEDLVARAWEQVGDILDANRALRFAQLARAAGSSVRIRCLAPLGPGQPRQRHRRGPHPGARRGRASRPDRRREHPGEPPPARAHDHGLPPARQATRACRPTRRRAGLSPARRHRRRRRHAPGCGARPAAGRDRAAELAVRRPRRGSRREGPGRARRCPASRRGPGLPAGPVRRHRERGSSTRRDAGSRGPAASPRRHGSAHAVRRGSQAPRGRGGRRHRPHSRRRGIRRGRRHDRRHHDRGRHHGRRGNRGRGHGRAGGRRHAYRGGPRRPDRHDDRRRQARRRRCPAGPRQRRARTDGRCAAR